MTRKIVVATLAVAVCVVVAHRAVSGDDIAKEMRQPTAAEMQQMMEQWMKLMTPGVAHDRLKPLVGKWDVKTKTFWGGPGSPPVESGGTAEREWVLDGRFIMEKHKGEVMMPNAEGGMKPLPFEGISMVGYDNYRNVYQGNWMDNMGTQMLRYTGSCDPSGKVFTYYGEMDEPSLQVVGRLVKYVTRIIDNDKHVFEMYDLHVGEDYKVMEITYTRKK